jgi:hypothetical protein
MSLRRNIVQPITLPVDTASHSCDGAVLKFQSFVMRIPWALTDLFGRGPRLGKVVSQRREARPNTVARQTTSWAMFN